MFPPFFNATSTARVLSLLLYFLKQIFSGPHFQDIAYQPKAASRSAAGKAAKRDSIRGKVFEGGGGGLEGGGGNFLQKVSPAPSKYSKCPTGPFPPRREGRRAYTPACLQAGPPHRRQWREA